MIRADGSFTAFNYYQNVIHNYEKYYFLFTPCFAVGLRHGIAIERKAIVTKKGVKR